MSRPLPLQGKRIVVTRSPEQAAEFCARLVQLGAEPIAIPTIRFAPLPSEPLDAALGRLANYDWLLFTSSNGVEFFFRRVDDLGLAPVLPRVAVSGPATAGKLRERGMEPALTPEEFVGEQLVTELGDLAGRRVLLPRAKMGRPQIVALLQAQGATVDEIPLYDTVMAEPSPQALAEMGKGFDAVTFASPSSVRYFLRIVESRGPGRWVLDRAAVACIGPVTAEAAAGLGLTVHITAAEYTVDGLVQALVAYYQRGSEAV